MKKLVASLWFFLLLYACQIEQKQQSNFSDQAEIKSIENSLGNRIQVGEIKSNYNLLDRMKYYNVPGISIAIVSGGELKWAKGYGILNTSTNQEVDENTRFQAASISKPITALGILRLVDEGKIGLDKDVNSYLSTWRIPDNEFTKEKKITVRQLLTHTAGLNVHGFPGYKPGEKIPDLQGILNGEGNTDSIQVYKVPGSSWKYSGGGYTILQQLIEDVSRKPFEVFMKEEVLSVLEMNNSTFEQLPNNSVDQNISAAFDSKGNMIAPYGLIYPEKAAAGLWTTPSDLAKYCLEIQRIISGKENGVLTKQVVKEMLTKHQNNWGLGPVLEGDADLLRFGHQGRNAGFTCDMIAFVHKGEGVIAMTNAAQGNKLIAELFRAVSYYYKWNIRPYKIVIPYKMANHVVFKLAGNYLYDEHDGKVGVKLSVKNDSLFYSDTTFNVETTLIPIGQHEFVAPFQDIELKFELDSLGNVKEFMLNNRWKHKKIKSL